MLKQWKRLSVTTSRLRLQLEGWYRRIIMPTKKPFTMVQVKGLTSVNRQV